MKWWIRHRLLKPWLLWNDVYWWFMHRTFKRFDVVYMPSLKPGYYDADERILHACFDTLAQFVEKEKPFEYIDWDWDDEYSRAAAEIKALYKWWKEDRPARKTALDLLSDELRPEPFSTWTTRPDGSSEFGDSERVREELEWPAYARACKTSAAQEVAWAIEDDENLIRLIKVRRYLWT